MEGMRQLPPGPVEVQQAEQTSRLLIFWEWLQRRLAWRDLCGFGGFARGAALP